MLRIPDSLSIPGSQTSIAAFERQPVHYEILLHNLRITRKLCAQCLYNIFVDRAARVALNVDNLASLGVDQLSTADGAVRTDALRDLGAPQPRCLRRVQCPG